MSVLASLFSLFKIASKEGHVALGEDQLLKLVAGHAGALGPQDIPGRAEHALHSGRARQVGVVLDEQCDPLVPVQAGEVLWLHLSFLAPGSGLQLLPDELLHVGAALHDFDFLEQVHLYTCSLPQICGSGPPCD